MNWVQFLIYETTVGHTRHSLWSEKDRAQTRLDKQFVLTSAPKCGVLLAVIELKRFLLTLVSSPRFLVQLFLEDLFVCGYFKHQLAVVQRVLVAQSIFFYRCYFDSTVRIEWKTAFLFGIIVRSERWFVASCDMEECCCRLATGAVWRSVAH